MGTFFSIVALNENVKEKFKKKLQLVGIEPTISRVWGERPNH